MSRNLRSTAAALGVLAILALPAGALGAGGSRAPDLSCNAAYTGGTYANLTVPPNGYCALSAVTVLGSATVQKNGDLEMDNSGSIGRSLLAGSGASVYEDSGWVVDGVTAASGASDLTLDGTLHGVLTMNTSGLYLQGATVHGDLVSNRSNGFGSVFDTTITGSVIVNGSVGDPNFGGSGSWTISGSPEIDGSVLVTGNQVPVDVDSNEITQNLICGGNNPLPVDYANQVGGRSVGQCSSPNTGSATATRAYTPKAAIR